MSNTDPAVKHYWFGKAYRDVIAVIVSSWKANGSAAGGYWSTMTSASGTLWKTVPQRIFLFLASCSVMVFGTLTWLMAVPIHMTIVLVIGACVLASFLMANMAEQLYLAARGWSFFCKNCKNKFRLAEYACSNCGAWHARLRPSAYGIFRRRCICGARIPSGHFFGRDRLKARCPHCTLPVNAAVDAVAGNTVVALIGAPSSGKSAYLTAAATTLIEQYIPSRGWTVEFSDPADQAVYARLVADIARYGSTSKTMNEKLPAFNFLVKGIGGLAGQRQVFLCDLAGEAFQKAEKLAAQKQLSHATGAIFIFDPFALPDIRNAYETDLRRRGAFNGVSRENPGDVLARAVISLQDHHGLRADGAVNFPLAVVVTKTDLIGSTVELTDDATIRNWLQRRGAADFIQQAQIRFPKLRFFAASALSHSKTGNLEMSSAGVLAPLLWILTTAKDPLAPRGTDIRFAPARAT